MAIIPGTGIINPALTLLGVLSTGETPSTAETADGLRLLNAMWANWNGDDLLQGITGASSGTWTGGLAANFLGGAGSTLGYTGIGPSRLRQAYVVLSSQRVPLEIRNWEWYRGLRNPTLQDSIPQFIVHRPPQGDGLGAEVYVWPVPAGNVTIGFTFLTPYPELADATTGITLNPQALQASIYNLAVAFASAFGVSLPPTVEKTAEDSLVRLRNFDASQWNQDPNPPQGQALQPPAQPTP